MGFVILEPEECVGHIIGVALKEKQGSPESFTEGKMIGNNDSAVRACSRSTFLSQQYVVFHVKGQDEAAMASGKDELFRI